MLSYYAQKITPLLQMVLGQNNAKEIRETVIQRSQEEASGEE